MANSSATNHPVHYNKGKIEVWDFIIDQNLDFIEGNIVKYICRYTLKGGYEDLLKDQMARSMTIVTGKRG